MQPRKKLHLPAPLCACTCPTQACRMRRLLLSPAAHTRRSHGTMTLWTLALSGLAPRHQCLSSWTSSARPAACHVRRRCASCYRLCLQPRTCGARVAESMALGLSKALMYARLHPGIHRPCAQPCVHPVSSGPNWRTDRHCAPILQRCHRTGLAATGGCDSFTPWHRGAAHVQPPRLPAANGPLCAADSAVEERSSALDPVPGLFAAKPGGPLC